MQLSRFLNFVYHRIAGILSKPHPPFQRPRPQDTLLKLLQVLRRKKKSLKKSWCEINFTRFKCAKRVVWILQFYERLWNLLPILKPFLFLIKWYLKRELHTKIRSNFGKKTDANSQYFFPWPQNFTAVSSFPTNAYVWLLAWITNYTN